MIKLYLTVFFGRLIDVAIATIRINTSVKGKIKLSFFLGFIEALLYFIVVRQALINNDSIYQIAISYALGYALGILIGTYLTHNIINDDIIIQAIITNVNIIELIREKGYIVSIIKLNNTYDNNEKYMLFIQTKRKMIKELINLIYLVDKETFLLINETKKLNKSYV